MKDHHQMSRQIGHGRVDDNREDENYDGIDDPSDLRFQVVDGDHDGVVEVVVVNGGPEPGEG